MSIITYIPKRFLVIDDHTIIRSALHTVLLEMYPDSLIEESVDGLDVIDRLRDNTYDLIITDIQMPGNNAIGLIKQVRSQYASVPVLIYSMTSEKIYGIGGLKAGAKGFVSKSASMEELKKAIEIVIRGKRYLSKDMLDLISGQALKPDKSFYRLSPRELQIVELLLAGSSVIEISKILGLKNSTVGTHKSHIFQKLQIGNLLELKAVSENFLY